MSASSNALLAIDSSTERLCLALQFGGGEHWVDQTGGAQASAQLLPQLLGLLAQAGTRLADLDAIAFACGPGAFTGLRTACAVAQGLAFGAARPVLALDSLLIVAEDARVAAGAPPVFDLWVVMDARMDEVYAGRYAWSDGRWTVHDAPALYDLPTLHARWHGAPPAALAGSALQAFGERLQVGAAAQYPVQQQRAAALLRVAQQAWQRGDTLDAADALPLYLRDKVALTTAERAAAKAGEAAG
ncbi:tRNA (adenosine(37)-N6)-threonylcarbamoyltransferase complex dimerization subunit type 1 TsaB [Ideonella sp. BN130291]|uniref:tRNA (adenosine(37)-N6)-threonylcarbamoyltransferase complex dimerization subunit type 1 TsaB n=1 Tax=Ideonella sp. BN130291 TaxID=3112940 RepID=UPI002E25DFF5|nr:tRNA (adenosine(37)-N6)-threonylcarbamoyltransferase complex dimerization subunit type 1 TsaB [Ideonella sp. BN130291]